MLAECYPELEATERNIQDNAENYTFFGRCKVTKRQKPISEKAARQALSQLVESLFSPEKANTAYIQTKVELTLDFRKNPQKPLTPAFNTKQTKRKQNHPNFTKDSTQTEPPKKRFRF